MSSWHQTEKRACPHTAQAWQGQEEKICMNSPFKRSHLVRKYVLLFLLEAADQKMERGQEESLLAVCGILHNSCYGCMWSFYGNQMRNWYQSGKDHRKEKKKKTG